MSGRAVVRGGSDVSLGDPNLLDSGNGDFSADVYAGSADFEKACKRGYLMPRRGTYAVAGVGYTHMRNGAEEVELKGPNVGLGMSVGLEGARIMCQAELASLSSTVGPATAKVGLSAETGADISLTQLEAKVLGTGVSFGRKIGFSLFGSGFEFELW